MYEGVLKKVFGRKVQMMTSYQLLMTFLTNEIQALEEWTKCEDQKNHLEKATKINWWRVIYISIKPTDILKQNYTNGVVNAKLTIYVNIYKEAYAEQKKQENQ